MSFYNYYPLDVIFTTAHKAKGLEFDTVKLADDFLREPLEDEG